MATLDDAGVLQERQQKATPEKTGKGQHRGYERHSLETPSSFRRLGCSVTRKYGAIEINFSVDAEFDVGSNDEQKRVLGMLYKQVNDMHDEWALNELPHIPNLEKQRGSDGAGEYEADYIYWNTEREPKRLMLVTTSGKYSKYGAKLDPSVFFSFFKMDAKTIVGESKNKFIAQAYGVVIDDNGFVSEIFRKEENAT